MPFHDSRATFFILQEIQNSLILFICSKSEEIDKLFNELTTLFAALKSSRLLDTPQELKITTFLDDESNSKKTQFSQIGTLYNLLQGNALNIILSTLTAITQKTLSFEEGLQAKLTFNLQQQLNNISQKITSLGYQKADLTETPGTFSLRGEILDIFPVQYHLPVRIELYINTIEKIRFFDFHTQRTLKDQPILSSCEILPTMFKTSDHTALLDILNKKTNLTIIWNDKQKCIKNWIETSKKIEENNKSHQLYSYKDLDIIHQKLNSFKQVDFNLKSLTKKNIHLASQANPCTYTIKEYLALLPDYVQKDFKIIIFYENDYQFNLISNLLKKTDLFLKEDPIFLRRGRIENQLFLENEKIIILNVNQSQKSFLKKKDPNESYKLFNKKNQNFHFFENDLVVHKQHGIGRYLGLKIIRRNDSLNDFLLIEYADQAKLYLPVYRLYLLNKYNENRADFPLDHLGSDKFRNKKQKIKNSVEKLAANLIENAAKRKLNNGYQFNLRDADLIEFEKEFPFHETEDQLQAIEDILIDLNSGQIMDRIICGDVGFGKTEVAMRAAFQVVSAGKQVAILVPTTLLAHQHELSFKNRFKNHPIIIESLSRLKTAIEQKNIIKDLKNGKIDIIIGTHRILSKDIVFSDLGLVIIDEEHRFGVTHKEKLKNLKINTHFLTLSATPIPRTLSMALSGLKNISFIHTAPHNRLTIDTKIIHWDETVLKQAIQFELNRKGQIFFVHNHIQTMPEIKKNLQKWFPTIRIEIMHAAMPETMIEKIILAFQNKAFEILICTTIIESGIDLPSVNTIFIHHADRLGLTQLYQLRGRVGRGSEKGYAYLIIPHQFNHQSNAMRRVQTIENLIEFSNSFQIACADLEIRGGGDFLGEDQSGQIHAIGFDLYCELLEKTIEKIQNPLLADPFEESLEPEINTHISAYFDENFIQIPYFRLSFYRRLASCKTDSEIQEIHAEIQDRFGKLPQEAENLIWLILIKNQLKKMNIISLTTSMHQIKIVSLEGTIPQKKLFQITTHQNQEIYQFLKTMETLSQKP